MATRGFQLQAGQCGERASSSSSQQVPLARGGPEGDGDIGRGSGVCTPGFLCLGCRRFDFFSSSREEESFHKLTQLSKRRSVDPCFSERDSRHAGSRGRAFARSRSRGRGQRPRPGYRCCLRGATLSVCKRAFPGANGVPRADLPELSRARAAFRGVRLPSQVFRGAAWGPRRVLCFSKRVAPTGRARSSWASGPGGSDRGPGMISAS